VFPSGVIAIATGLSLIPGRFTPTLIGGPAVLVAVAIGTTTGSSVVM